MGGWLNSQRAASGILLASLFLMGPVGSAAAVSPPSPSTPGLVALYEFNEGAGALVQNRSAAGSVLDLKIDDPTAVQWHTDSLTVMGSTRIRGTQEPDALFLAMTWTGEVSLEVWIETATVDQKGPARIVTFSKNGSERNFTLGQDGNRIDVRFRTSTTTGNGIPSLAAAESSLAPKLTHVIYTRDRSGHARVYVDGQISAEDTIGGSLATWNGGYQLALGNEMADERPWQGTFHRVALYNRALRAQEVTAHFQGGASGSIDGTPATAGHSDSARLFEENVAPIFAKHCIECHDPAKNKGDLDLSTRASVFPEDGATSVIVPGDLVASVLWESVESDDMPKKRDPLSADEKVALKAWIESGAEWTHDRIDPVVYLRGGDSGAVFSRRLTTNEYIATVQATLGVDIATEARDMLPPDVRADGFLNTAYNLNVDLKHVDAYAQLAEIATDKLDVATFVSQFVEEQELNEKSARRLVNRLGTWILRGPLDDHETSTYASIVPVVVSSGGDYEETVRYVIAAMIQSPRFLYRIENQRGDGALWPANDYERASRLSYALWGSSPDNTLMAAARKGALYTREDLSAQIDRMLLDPRAITYSKQFAYEWLDLGRMEDLRPSPQLFPDWDPALGPAMREETLAFFEEVVWTQQRPLADLFNAQVTFLSPALAMHYGLEHSGDGLARYDLTEVPERGGLLTQGSLLTMGGDDASMVS